MATRKEVDVKHPVWKDNNQAWIDTQIMYEGDPVISRQAERFLLRRPQEDESLYRHRLSLFVHENHLGTGLGYYEAQMFDQDPEVSFVRKGPDGNPDADAKLSPKQDWYSQTFLKNCDGRGTPFLDKMQKVFQYLMLFESAWVLTDLPKQDKNNPPASLKDQQDRGDLDPRIVLLSPLEVINWDMDECGNLNWAVVFSQRRDAPFMGKTVAVDCWYYYDRQQYRVYEQRLELSDSMNAAAIVAGQEKAPVALVDQGPHALAAYNVVPLRQIVVPTSWGLARRAYSPAKAHICALNERRWSLHMAALAIPILFTDREVSSIRNSEAGCLVMDKDDRYEYAEPPGRSWAELAREKQEFKEEIFRCMYLVAMSRSTSATAASQSGLSKQEDMAPSHAVLSGLGAVLRAGAQAVVQDVINARAALAGFEEDKDLLVDIRGWQFEDKLTVEEIDVIQTVLSMEIPSDLFEKELFRATVRAFLKNSNPDTLEAIFEEIQKAPSKKDRDAQDLADKAQALRQQIRGTNNSPVLNEVPA